MKKLSLPWRIYLDMISGLCHLLDGVILLLTPGLPRGKCSNNRLHLSLRWEDYITRKYIMGR